MDNCADLMRLTMIAQSPAHYARFQNTTLLKPKKGSWITDLSLIPTDAHDTAQINKRPYPSSGLQGNYIQHQGDGPAYGGPEEMALVNNNGEEDVSNPRTVYGDPDRTQNPDLWKHLELYLQDQTKPVCLLGDFNAIASATEKWGGSQYFSTQNRAFRAWIAEAGLIDLGHHDPAYTWSNKQTGYQNISERLDRGLSDHLPILLRTNPNRRRARPGFRCENWWMKNGNFKGVCQEVAAEPDHDWNQFARIFKKRVSRWANSQVSLSTQLKRIEDEMLQLNAAVPDPEQKKKEDQLQIQHQKTLQMLESYWHQCSRVNWALLGDQNSKFFHAMAVNRKRMNTIRAIRNSQGEWLTEEPEIRKAFVEEAFPQQLLQQLPQIPDYTHHHLCAIPTEQEIRAALNLLGPHKAPGPNGFNAKIFQDYWDCFGVLVTREVQKFFEIGVMPREVARSNLVLVPKSEEAITVEQYRPISSAFVPGRDISESVVLLREIIHSFGMPGYKNKDLCLKADLSKAFDRMDWAYLTRVMTLYGFPQTLVHWISECISSIEYTVVINRVGGGFFKPLCGLRQGCALSPYLFILGMDLLARQLHFMTEIGRTQGVKITRSAEPIAACIYADDLLIMGAATGQEARDIKQSLPIYYMSTIKIPNTVLEALNGMIRKFLWGAMDKGRYMSYISWDKITMPKDKGGLGLRNLRDINEALLLKSLWKLVAGSQSPWAKLVAAKYLPKSDLWHSKRTYKCTTFWRNLMGLRTKLVPLLTWKLGDGGTCTIFAQPWYQQGIQPIPSCQADRQLKVKDLVDDSGRWNVEKMTGLLGLQASVQILATVKPSVPIGAADRLIFTPSKDGNFSVKKAYTAIRDQTAAPLLAIQTHKTIWRAIRSLPNVQPRVRLFLWKVMHDGLPLAKTLAHRIGKGDPTCAHCGMREESMAHMLFHCDFARRCWLMGPVPLLTSNLLPDIIPIFEQYLIKAPQEQWGLLANTMWAIWRCRNDCMYQGKSPTHDAFVRYLREITNETWLASNQPRISPEERLTIGGDEKQEYLYHCYIDGAWSQIWQGGTGFIIFRKEELEVYRAEGVLSSSAIQSEAKALLAAILYAEQHNLMPIIFYSDCQELVRECKGMGPPVNADWRAYQEIFQSWVAIRRNRNFEISYVSRSHNELADSLAKKRRREGINWTYTGTTFPLFLE
ncbi:uncharacterized protein LOC144568085 [Carex rostrata]